MVWRVLRLLFKGVWPCLVGDTLVPCPAARITHSILHTHTHLPFPPSTFHHPALSLPDTTAKLSQNYTTAFSKIKNPSPPARPSSSLSTCSSPPSSPFVSTACWTYGHPPPPPLPSSRPPPPPLHRRGCALGLQTASSTIPPTYRWHWCWLAKHIL